MKEMEAIGSPVAKAEHEARRQMMKEDEEKIFKKEIKKHNVNIETTVNWAPFNWILSTVSFKDVKDVSAGMRLMFSYLWGHIRRYDLELNTLKNYIAARESGQTTTALETKRTQEIINSPTPLEMCVTSLEKITSAARSRAKLNSYGIEVEKRSLLKGGNSDL